MTSAVEQVAARGLARELLRACRPNQWVKNVLVLAAPAAAGVALRTQVLADATLALVAMTLVAAGCYLTNDVVDAGLDRLHPQKRFRPVASGAVPEQLAVTVSATLLLAGLGVAAAVSTALLGVVALYVALTLAYALVLKGVPWLELGVVASGFLLRAYAGAVAVHVEASEWFMLVVSLAAVNVVTSKRTSELVEGDARTRPALRAYTLGSLRAVRLGSAVLLVLAYAGWALHRPGSVAPALALTSLAAVVVVLVRWSNQTDRGATGAPEEAVVRDRVLRLGVAVWLVCFALTVVAGTWHA